MAGVLVRGDIWPQTLGQGRVTTEAKMSMMSCAKGPQQPVTPAAGVRQGDGPSQLPDPALPAPRSWTCGPGGETRPRVRHARLVAAGFSSNEHTSVPLVLASPA